MNTYICLQQFHTYTAFSLNLSRSMIKHTKKKQNNIKQKMIEVRVVRRLYTVIDLRSILTASLLNIHKYFIHFFIYFFF